MVDLSHGMDGTQHGVFSFICIIFDCACLSLMVGLSHGMDGTQHGVFRYLHEVCSPSIIHKNIKSANILLDAELNPHLSDSGLANFIPNADEVVLLFEILMFLAMFVEALSISSLYDYSQLYIHLHKFSWS